MPTVTDVPITPFENGPTAGPTDTPLPPQPDRVWAQQPFGSGNITIAFSTNSGLNCVNYVIDSPEVAFSTPVQQCADPLQVSVTAAQGVQTDKSGKQYTIIVGEALTNRVAAVSIEFDKAANTNVQVIDRGFLVILPGRHNALRVIPVDDHGNLVNRMFPLTPAK